VVQASPRPDWYLLWYFAVLALLPHGLERYVMVGAPLFGGLVLVLLPLLFNRGERHPRRRPWAVGTVLMVVASIGTFWIAGLRAPWSPDFAAAPLGADVIGATHGPVYEGARIFEAKGCIYCHRVSGDGGRRGPELTTVGDRLTEEQMISRILNGGRNMPAYGNILAPSDLRRLVVFLRSRHTRGARTSSSARDDREEIDGDPEPHERAPSEDEGDEAQWVGPQQGARLEQESRADEDSRSPEPALESPW
jgi:ubiquinol-cytochrome c reductase cytochrome b subunit